MGQKSGIDLRNLLTGYVTRSENRMEIVYRDVYDLIPSKDNFYQTDDIEDLKTLIEIFGVLQPVLITETDSGDVIRSGHRRCLACKALTEEGKAGYRDIPCVIKTEEDLIEVDQEESEEREENQSGEAEEIGTLLNQLSLIAANSYRDKSDWERMEEALRSEKLIIALRKKTRLRGKTREIVKNITGGKEKEAQLGRYKVIKKNLCPALMEKFREGKIGVTVAHEAAGLSLAYQRKAYDILEEKEKLSIMEVQQLKEQERGETTFEVVTPDERQKEVVEEEAEEREEDVLIGAMNAPEEPEDQEEFEPVPQEITSLCYSCEHYRLCDVKSNTVRNCNQYSSKAEAEKTDEQRYTEEQDKIDRETRRKLREKEREETAREATTGEAEKKPHEIRLASSRWGDITTGVQTFLLLRKDGYQVNDDLLMREYAGGKETGRTIEVRIIYIEEDSTGLDDDYCIIGINEMSFDA